VEHRLGAQVAIADVVEVDAGLVDREGLRVGLLRDERVESSSSKTRSVPARPARPRRPCPRTCGPARAADEVGWRRRENVPMLISPWIASHPPSARTPTCPSAGDGLQRRCVARLEPDGPHPGPVEAGGGVGEPGELAVLLAEALHDAHAVDRLVDDARHLARALQRIPLRGEHRLAQLQRHEEQGGNDGQHDHGQQR